MRCSIGGVVGQPALGVERAEPVLGAVATAGGDDEVVDRLPDRRALRIGRRGGLAREQHVEV